MRVSSIGKRLRENPLYAARFCEHISTDDDQSLNCKQRIYVICPHCQRSLCLHHINEHQRLIRSVFDGLVNRLNEYRYELTVNLRIPANSETMVKNCLEEFQTTIIPYVQRTCCENDVKQEDVNRIQMFIDKMQTVIQRIRFHWEEIEREQSHKRSNNDSDQRIENSLTTVKRVRLDSDEQTPEKKRDGST